MWRQDVRTALRALRANRGTTWAAILTLALAMGATATVLAVGYGVLLRPLPFRDPDRLVHVALPIPLQQVAEWQLRTRTLTALTGYAVDDLVVRGTGGPQNVRTALIAGPLLDVLDVRPTAGRAGGELRAEEALVSERFARRIAIPSRALLGRTLSVDGRSYSIAGVLPEAVAFPDEETLLWLPANSVDPVALFGAGDTRTYSLIGRLHAHASLAAARDESEQILAAVDPAHAQELTGLVTPLATPGVTDELRTVVWLAGMAAGFLFLVACANVTTLLISRSLSRRRELAIRLALGGTPARLVRTALLESAFIAVAAAALATLFARAALGVLLAFTGQQIPRTSAVAIDLPVIGAMAGVALLASFLCGTAPALVAARSDLGVALRRYVAVGTLGRRLGAALTVAQVAGAAVLLIGAGLLGRTVTGLLEQGAGIHSEHAFALTIDTAQSTRFDAGSRRVFMDQLLARVRRLPGVVAAGGGVGLPPRESLVMSVSMNSDTGNQRNYPANLVPVTAGYFEALGIRLLRGRRLDESDDRGNEAVAVLSQRAARELTFEHDPLGKRLSFPLPTSAGGRVNPRVVGIVSDVRYSGLDQADRPTVYVPWRQLPVGTTHLVVRVAGDPRSLMPTVSHLVHELDSTVPIGDSRTLKVEINRAIAGREVRFWLVAYFSIVALAVALVGLFAKLGRGVTERRREIGVRMALGATRRQAILLVIREGVWIGLVGLSLGLIVAVGLARWMASLLWGVSAYDALAYVATASVILGGCLVASYAPARRAASLDPVETLRAE